MFNWKTTAIGSGGAIINVIAALFIDGVINKRTILQCLFMVILGTIAKDFGIADIKNGITPYTDYIKTLYQNILAKIKFW